MKLIYLVSAFAAFTCCSCIDLGKCSLYDMQCQLDFFQTIGRDKAFTGIPELGIPVIDPFKLTNVQMPILGLWNLTLVEGEATGIQQCLVSKYETNVPKRYKEPEMTCGKIVIRGHFKLTSAPIVKNKFTDIHGEGFGKITIDNWFFRFRYPFKIVREANGQIYSKGIFERAIYETRMDKVVLEVSGIKMGILDISNPVSTFVNDHWELIMASDIGKFITDRSAKYYYDIYSIFFNNVPANQYLTDDLTDLVENDDVGQYAQRNEL